VKLPKETPCVCGNAENIKKYFCEVNELNERAKKRRIFGERPGREEGKLFFLSASLLGKAGGASCIGTELAVIAVLARMFLEACVLRDIDEAFYPFDPSVVRILIIVHAGMSFLW
jgi:hypothetical protein